MERTAAIDSGIVQTAGESFVVMRTGRVIDAFDGVTGGDFSIVYGETFVSLVAGASCPADFDFDGDGAVEVDDLIALLIAWGSADPELDLDESGAVDVARRPPFCGGSVSGPALRGTRPSSRLSLIHI